MYVPARLRKIIGTLFGSSVQGDHNTTDGRQALPQDDSAQQIAEDDPRLALPLPIQGFPC